MSLIAKVAELQALANNLHASGAVRPEHATAFSSLRTGFEQLHELASEAQAAGTPVPGPDVVAFEQIRDQIGALATAVDQVGGRVETLAMTTDGLADLVRAQTSTEPAAG